MSSEQYPTDGSGATASLAMAFDTMGRLNTLTDTLASVNIIASASYGPANELLSLTAGNYSGNWGSETRTYNAMKQLTSLTSNGVSLTYTFSATHNNGKITSQTDAISGETVAYQYDALNRLASAAASGTWSQSYNYDGFGNLTAITGTGANSFTIDPATNHAPCSDANGNADEVSCAGTFNGYTYNISNRVVVTPSGSPGGTMDYSYAPSGMRVWRGNGSSTDELTFWSPGGQKLATYNLSSSGGNLKATQTGTNYYFGGKLIKNKNGWVNADRLGSVGKYYPYGTDKGSGNPANDKEKIHGLRARRGYGKRLRRESLHAAGEWAVYDAGSLPIGRAL